MRTPVTRLASSCLLLALAACADQNPAALREAPAPGLPPSAVAALTCTVSVREATVACARPDATLPAGVSGAIVGGQGSYVQLTSSNVSYDGTSVFRADVTIANLTAQALGTTDGVTPSPEGVRVFFSTLPYATAGSGPVEVANADGEAFFTAAAQKYFAYAGLLAPGDTSAAKEWRFTVPASVTSFTFGVYVAAPVRAEAGWVSVSPIAPSLLVADSMDLAATVHNLAGSPLTGQAVTWSSATPAVATVDAQGRVRGLSAGTARITATSGGRTASVDVRVYTDPAQPVASIVRFRPLQSTITADGVDSIGFEVEMRGAGLPPAMIVRLLSPNGHVRAGCSGPVEFTSATEGRYRCFTTMPEGSLSGAWRVDSVTAGPTAFAGRGIAHAGLVAAGAPAHVYVDSPNEDLTPPMLVGMTLSPTTITAGQQTVVIDAVATWEGMYAQRMDVWVSSAGNPRIRSVAQAAPTTGGVSQFQVRFGVPPFFNGGTFTLDSVVITDTNNNRSSMSTAALAQAGFPSQFTVIGPNPDTVPPVITAFSFTPDTVAGNGLDSVTVTITAEEPAGASGTYFVDMEFEKASDPTVRRRCLRNDAASANPFTMTCRLAFGGADLGTWNVRYVRAIDRMNLSRTLFRADLEALGMPTVLVVEGTIAGGSGR